MDGNLIPLTEIINVLPLPPSSAEVLTGATGRRRSGDSDVCRSNRNSAPPKRVQRRRTCSRSERKSRISGSSRKEITYAPYDDGHEWRKYGQKIISKTKQQRSYYRCTHSEKGCKATKQVEPNDGEGDDPYLFLVTYNHHHTCGSAPMAPQFQIEAKDDDLVLLPSRSRSHSSFQLRFDSSGSSGIKIANQDPEPAKRNTSDVLVADHYLTGSSSTSDRDLLNHNHSPAITSLSPSAAMLAEGLSVTGSVDDSAGYGIGGTIGDWDELVSEFPLSRDSIPSAASSWSEMKMASGIEDMRLLETPPYLPCLSPSCLDDGFLQDNFVLW